jgi:DNA-binding ferritin-like protein (Dps family)
MVEDMKREYIGMENNMNLLNDLSTNPESIEKYLPEQSWKAFTEWKNIIEKI